MILKERFYKEEEMNKEKSRPELAFFLEKHIIDHKSFLKKLNLMENNILNRKV